MSFLQKNEQGYLVSETERECTNCRSIYKRTSKTVTLCPICNSNRVKCMSVESRMLNRARNRAKAKNELCNLEISDIKIPEYCPVLGIKLHRHFGKPGGRKDSPALDRIDNTKGYVKGNIWVISHLANMMKNSADKAELLKFAEWVILEHNSNKTNDLVLT